MIRPPQRPTLFPSRALSRSAKGPDGNIWFVNKSPAVVGKITPEGVITEYTDGLTTLSEPSAITLGPDGNLWFTETRSEEHTSELQSRQYLVCRLLLEKKKVH